MKNRVIVQSLEYGSRCEYYFKSLKSALLFIEYSEKKNKDNSRDKVQGVYEIYMPRSYK